MQHWRIQVACLHVDCCSERWQYKKIKDNIVITIINKQLQHEYMICLFPRTIWQICVTTNYNCLWTCLKIIGFLQIPWILHRHKEQIFEIKRHHTFITPKIVLTFCLVKAQVIFRHVKKYSFLCTKFHNCKVKIIKIVCYGT